jgi:serine/threonine protein kinase
VKVIDFGLAKVAKSLQQEVSLKQRRLSVLAQSVFGTFDYAPPEQQGYGGEPSAKSDVYAFGKTLYRLLTGEIPQTLHPRRLADAPALFELLCDCVEKEPEKRPDVETLISRLSGLSSETESSVPPKTIQAPQQLNNRIWWNQLNHRWKNIFRKAIGIKAEPTDSELEKIVQLQELDCRFNEISDLEPLRELTSLQRLNCRSNQISDLEPLRALTSLQILWCKDNQISWWNLRKFKKAMPNCRVYS